MLVGVRIAKLILLTLRGKKKRKSYESFLIKIHKNLSLKCEISFIFVLKYASTS